MFLRLPSRNALTSDVTWSSRGKSPAWTAPFRSVPALPRSPSAAPSATIASTTDDGHRVGAGVSPEPSAAAVAAGCVAPGLTAVGPEHAATKTARAAHRASAAPARDPSDRHGADARDTP